MHNDANSNTIQEVIQKLAGEVKSVIESASKRMRYVGPITYLGILKERQDGIYNQAVEFIGQTATLTVPILAATLISTEDNNLKLGILMVLFEGTNQVASQMIPALVSTLKDKDRDVRLWAVLTLGAMGSPATSCVKELVPLLADKNGFIHDAVVYALARIGNGAVPFLIEALKSENRDIVYGAARTLGELGKGAVSAIPALYSQMKKEKADYANGQTLAEALGKIGPEALPLLEGDLTNPDKEVRELVVTALGGMGAEGCTTLFKMINDPNKIIRYNVILGLSRATTDLELIIPKLLPKLRSKDKKLRECTAHVLGRLGEASKEVVNALLRNIEDEDHEVRFASLESLVELGVLNEQVTSALQSTLEAEDNNLVYSALNIIRFGLAGKTAFAVPSLLKLIKGSNKEIRHSAVYALGRSGVSTSEVVETLIWVLSDENLLVKLYSIEALGILPIADTDTGKLLPLLAEFLTDENSDIRYQTVLTLGEIGDKSVIPTLKMVANSDESVGWDGIRLRDMAAKVIKKIEEKGNSNPNTK